MSEGTVARQLRVEFTANISDLKNKMASIQSDMKRFTPAANSMQAAYQKSFRAMTSVSESLNRQMAAMDAELRKTGSLSRASLSGMADSLTDAEDAAQALGGIVDDLTTRLESLGSARLAMPEYRQAISDLVAASEAVDKYMERQERMKALGVSENSQAWKSLQYDIQVAEEAVHHYAQAVEYMQAHGEAFTLGADTEQYRTLESLARDVAAAQEEMRQRIQEGTSALAEQSAQAGRTAGGLSNAGTSAKGVGSSIASALKTGLLKVVSAAGSGLSKLGKRLLGIRQNALSVNTGLNSMVRSIRNIGVVSLGLRLCSSLFGRLRSVVSNCVSSNEAMSAAVERLKSGLSSALSPAISVVINLLSKLLPYLIGIADAIASLITNIFGKGWTSVSTGASSAASAIDGVTDATSGAAAAQEEYNKTLAGFDEITKLDDTSSSSSGGGGGGSSSTTAADTEGIAGLLPTWLTNLAAQIKELWADQDFSGIGALLAEKFGDAVDYLDSALMSEGFQSKLQKAMQGITDGINGFLSGITFKEEGKASIAERFGGFIGDAITTALNSIHTLLSGLSWGNVGTAVAQFLNGALEKINASDINFGTIFADIVNAFTDALGGLFDEFDWPQFGSTLAGNINSAISGINWAASAKTLSAGLVGMFSSLSTALEEINWIGLGENIWTYLKNINWSGIVSGLAETIGAALSGIGKLLWGFLRDGLTSMVDYFSDEIEDAGGVVGLGILTGLGKAFLSLDEWLIKNVVDPLVEGLFGIENFSEKIASWINEKIIQPVASALYNWAQNHPKLADLLFPDGFVEELELIVNATAEVDSVTDAIAKKDKTLTGFCGMLTSSQDVIPSDYKTLADYVAELTGTEDCIFSRTLPDYAAVLTSKIDNISNKTVTGVNARLDSKTDNISSKTLTSFTAQLDAKADNISSKTLTSFTAQLDAKADKISSKTLTGFTAQLTSKADNISSKTLTSFTAQLDSKTDNIINKTITGVTAQASKLTTASSLSKTISSMTFQASKLTSTVTKLTGLTFVASKLTSTVATVKTGGVLSGGKWSRIPQYAGGTTNAGSLFVAGEAGPEVVGHIGGRTEVLNASQLASVMYASVVSGISALGGYLDALGRTMANCAGAIIAALPSGGGSVSVPDSAWSGGTSGSGSEGLARQLAESIVTGLAGRQEQDGGQLVINVSVGDEQLVQRVIKGVNDITWANGGVCPIHV